MQKKPKILLEHFARINDNINTPLMGLAIRPQVSSEPGLFFALFHTTAMLRFIRY